VDRGPLPEIAGKRRTSVAPEAGRDALHAAVIIGAACLMMATNIHLPSTLFVPGRGRARSPGPGGRSPAVMNDVAAHAARMT
jgi:hypothetical protein